MTCQPRYYRRSQVDTMYNALQDQIGSVVEDTYTQADIDQMLAGYSPTGHTHPYSPDDHDHDWEYAELGHIHQRLIVLRDQKTTGTPGGSFAPGGWRTRDINTIAVDDTQQVVLSNNAVQLPGGVYVIVATCPAYRVGRHVTRLWNITTNAPLIWGTPEYGPVSVDAPQTRSIIRGRFSLATTNQLEVQHYCDTALGGGNAFGFGVNGPGVAGYEIYTEVLIWQQ